MLYSHLPNHVARTREPGAAFLHIDKVCLLLLLSLSLSLGQSDELDECGSEHIRTILDKSVPELKQLMQAVKETLQFEEAMCDKFSSQSLLAIYDEDEEGALELVNEGDGGGGDEQDQDPDDEPDDLNPHSAEAIRRRYLRFRQKQEKLKGKTQPQAKDEAPRRFSEISDAFDMYLTVYLEHEESYGARSL